MIPYDLHAAVAARPNQDKLIGLVVARLTEIGWPAAVFILPPHVVLVRRLTGASGTGQR